MIISGAHFTHTKRETVKRLLLLTLTEWNDTTTPVLILTIHSL